MVNKTIVSPRFTLKGWSLGQFIKGRDRLLITVIGGIVGFIATQTPLYAGISAGVAELLYSIIKFYVEEK